MSVSSFQTARNIWINWKWNSKSLKSTDFSRPGKYIFKFHNLLRFFMSMVNPVKYYKKKNIMTQQGIIRKNVVRLDYRFSLSILACCFLSFRRTLPKKLVESLERDSNGTHVSWSLVRRDNYYTTETHHAGNITSLEVQSYHRGWSLGPNLSSLKYAYLPRNPSGIL